MAETLAATIEEGVEVKERAGAVAGTRGKRGGYRPGAGRKKGSVTRRTREIAEQAIKQGITPLE